MKNKVIAIISAFSLLAGCGIQGNASVSESIAPKEQPAAMEEISQTSGEDTTENTEQTVQHKDPELFRDKDTSFACGENNDPEAAALVDEAFDQDTYHLAVYMNYKGINGDIEAAAREINTFRNSDKLESCKVYKMDEADEDSFLVQTAEEDGYKYQYKNSGPYVISTAEGETIYNNMTRMYYYQWDFRPSNRHYYLGEAIGDKRATCLDIFDALGSGKFSDLKKEGDIVTGRSSIRYFYVDQYGFSGSLLGGYRGDTEINCKMKFEDGKLKWLDARPDPDDQNNDFHYCIEVLDTHLEPGKIDGVVRYESMSEEFKQKKGTSTVDFDTFHEEDYVRWARFGGYITDPGNGVILRFYRKGYKEDDDSLKNVYVFLDGARYTDFEYFGDYEETVLRFEEWKAKKLAQ